MRYFVVIVFLCLSFLAGFVFGRAPLSDMRLPHIYFANVPDDKVEIIAHRGGNPDLGENSLVALTKASELGADILEIDLQQTKDGILVLLHDDRLERTTVLTGLIADKSFAEVKDVVDRLEDVFQALSTERFMIELKPNNKNVADQLCKLTKQYELEKQVLVASWHKTPIEHFRQVCPRVATSMYEREAIRFVLSSYLGLGDLFSTKAVALQAPLRYKLFDLFELDITDDRIFATAKNLNIKLHYWTINDRQDAQMLVEKGANGIITDDLLILQTSYIRPH